MIAGFGLGFTVSSSSAGSECCCLSLGLTLGLHQAAAPARHTEGHKVLLCALNQFLSQPIFAAAEMLTKVYRRRAAANSPSYRGEQTGFPGFHYSSLAWLFFLPVPHIWLSNIHGTCNLITSHWFLTSKLCAFFRKNEWGMFDNEREIEQVGTEFKCEVLFSSVSSPALGGSLSCVWKSHLKF